MCMITKMGVKEYMNEVAKEMGDKGSSAGAAPPASKCNPASYGGDSDEEVEA